MVLDTSVLLHVIFQEPGWTHTVAFLALQETCLLAASSAVEAQAVMSRRVLTDPYELLDVLLTRMRILVVDHTVAQSHAARRAYLAFGKGSGHRAQLNFGDAFSYALAKTSNSPLAFVGDDFGHTDLPTVRLPIDIPDVANQR